MSLSTEALEIQLAQLEVELEQQDEMIAKLKKKIKELEIEKS